jgi:thymidine phosphorylase
MRNEVDDRSRAVLDLSIELASRMVVMSKIELSHDVARRKLRGLIESGAALERFRDNVIAQGGDARVCDDPDQWLPLTPIEVTVESRRAGFLTRIDTTEVGLAVVELGGGRVTIDDQIDPGVGFMEVARVGEAIQPGDTLGRIFCRNESQVEAARARIQAAFQLGDAPPAEIKLIKEVITA